MKILLYFLLFIPSLCSAYDYTPAQITLLKAAVAGEPSIANCIFTANDVCIAEWLNGTASPEFVVWKTKITRDEIMNQIGFDWTLVDNLSTGSKYRIWEWMFNNRDNSINPSFPNIRAGIDATWVGTAGLLAVRTFIYTQIKRASTRAEKILATGTGTTLSPATLVFEGNVTSNDAGNMR